MCEESETELKTRGGSRFVEKKNDDGDACASARLGWTD